MVLIRLHYGPVETNGVIKHDIQKIHGLIDGLIDLDYDVQVIPSRFLNRLAIEIMGYEVHRRNIKYLQFNTTLDRDSVCIETIDELKKKVNNTFSHYFEKTYPRLSKNGQYDLRKL